MSSQPVMSGIFRQQESSMTHIREYYEELYVENDLMQDENTKLKTEVEQMKQELDRLAACNHQLTERLKQLLASVSPGYGESETT